ncbi:hypothetical protein SLW70_06460 [Flavobacterium sp. NG2]|nr:hypothetical protein [Flavobacterium sp. NG2]WPR72768.1 hypothetical protein SLW70_06460 [Flavobacterium sp. NG2]
MKIIIFSVLVLLLQSCAVNGRVCGGSGGKRCVEIQEQVAKLNLKNV